jgi:hypothetical protein
VDQFERLGRADGHARRLPLRPAFLAPVWSVDAQVALGGFFLVRIPDRPMGSLRTGLDTPPAADAFSLIDRADIAMFGIYISSPGRAILDAKRRNALSTYGHYNIERILGERWSIPDDLDSG